MGAGAAENATSEVDFAFVDDLLPASIAVDARAWFAEDSFDGRMESDFLNGQQFIIGHGLVAAQLREVVAQEVTWRHLDPACWQAESALSAPNRAYLRVNAAFYHLLSCPHRSRAARPDRPP